MIRDLTESLKAILIQPGLPAELAAAQISFDRPVEPFNPAHSTVNLFLYDVRENSELRINEPTVNRLHGVATITQPPRRILCSYLVTAWVNSGTEVALQEHRLLGQVLQVLARFPVIPTALAVNSIKSSDPPVALQVAMGTSTTGVAEFWSSLGAKLRASLTLQATLSLPIYNGESVPLVESTTFHLHEITTENT